MKTILVVVGMFLVSALPVAAKLGETGQQMTARYGSPVEVAEGPDSTQRTMTFRSGNYRVVATFENGLVTSESYSKNEGERSFTQAELDSFLSANDNGQRWDQVGSPDFSVVEWRRSDGLAHAVYLPNAELPSLNVNMLLEAIPPARVGGSGNNPAFEPVAPVVPSDTRDSTGPNS